MLKPRLAPGPFCCLLLIQLLFKLDSEISLGSLTILLFIPYSVLIQN